MKLFNEKLLTIVCEVLAKRIILEVLEKNHVSGYTMYPASGKGEKGVRGEGIPEESNLKIEIVLSQERSESVIEEISRKLFADYSIILYLSDVEVARAEKFH
jgi:nitrogen regulatory protein PII